MTEANAIADERNAKERERKGLPPKKPEDQTTTATPAPVIPTKPAPVPEGGDSAPPAPAPTHAADVVGHERGELGGTGAGGGNGGGGASGSGTATQPPAQTHAARRRRRRAARGARRRHQRARAVAAVRPRARPRPRPRHVAVAARAEAPVEVDGLGDADPPANVDRRRRQPGARGSMRIGPSSSDVRLSSRPIPSACVSLPGPLQRSSSRATRRRARMTSMPVERLQRPDEHRGARIHVVADGVEQGVDAVGAVDVGDAGRPEERRGARRQARPGVRGGLGAVVGLGLDDDPGGVAVAHDAADEVGRDLEHRAVVEGGRRSQQRAGALELLAHTRQRRPALADLRLEPRD